MEEKIKSRIAELEKAEQDTIMQLMAVRTVLAELRVLIETPIITEGEDAS
jgi:hypothetical protein